MKKKRIDRRARPSCLNKCLLVMKLTFLLLTVSFLHVSAGLYSQNAKLTLNMQNAKIIDVLEEIERQSEFRFAYSTEYIDLDRVVSVKLAEKRVEEVLKVLFEGTNVKNIVHDRHIMLFPENLEAAQPRIIAGQVRDESGDPIVGVTIIVKGTSIGTITNAEGKFTLQDVSDDGVLVFSFVGMKTKEVNIGDENVIDIQMEFDAINLDEVVAIGYGSLSKRNISGSITNIAESDFRKGVTQTAADILQGRVAGLTITTESGDVTAQQTMRLRGTSSLTGSSSPFVVIDGVPGMDLNSVAPQDIESISILKDASAVAIYGSRSASGVILITTKKGKSGQESVNYNTYVAIETATDKPELLSASQWREYTKDMNVTGLDKGADTDWFDEIMRIGISQNHNLSITGGITNGSYRASINYLDRQGIMRDNELKRYNSLFSLNKRVINEKLNISLTGGSVLSNYSPTNSYNTVLAYNMLPVYPVKNPDGSWFEIQEWEQGNPVRNIEENSNVNKSSLLYGNVKADMEILTGLTAGVNLFKQRNSTDNSTYNASTTQAGRQAGGYAYRGNQLWNKDLFELTLDYSKIIGQHDFKLLGGYSYEYNSYESVGASNRSFISDMFQYNNLSAGENLFSTDVRSYKNMNKLISVFGRLNYVFNGKYILTATIRQDGSSKFGANNKWGTFPSVSGAWRISDETFMQDLGLFNELKIRVGYGVVGNQDGIGPYTSIAMYGLGDEYFDNGKWRNTYKYSQNDNPDLRWEQTASFNPGMDFSLLNYRLSGSVDYYIKKTSDLLYVYNVPVPPYLYPTMLANVGDISNKGIEVVLTGQILKNSKLKWTSTFNFAHNKNIIDRLSNDVYQTEYIKTGFIDLRGSGYLTSHIVEEGQEVGTFYNLRCLGIDQDGKFIIDDVYEDGVINNLDYTYIGHAMPRFSYGLLNTFSYKNIDFSFFIRGLYGNDVLNTPRVQYSNPKWLPGGNVLSEVLTNGITDEPLFSSYFIEDGSFLRMDNVNLAYNLGGIERIGIKDLRVYANVQNLFIITKFSGPDPEVRMSGLNPGELDKYFIPKPRIFSIGLDVKF